MKIAVKEFIDKMGKGKYFDSHAVIFFLIKNYPDIYIQNVGKYKTVESYHGLYIAKLIIGYFVKQGVIEKIGEQASFSKNIKDEFSPCDLWQKL